MLPRTTLFATLGFLVLAAGLPTPVQAAALFYETTVVTDTADDYATNGALDLVAVHLVEKFRYNSDTSVGEEILVVRFEPRAFSELACPGEIRYTLNFKLDGQETSMYGGAAKTPSTAPSSCQASPIDGNGKTTIPTAQDSLLVTLPKATLGAAEGSSFTGFWAISHVVAGSQLFYHDVAPHPNNNAPQNAAPTDGLSSYTGNGTFPFVTVEPLTPTQQFSVGGTDVQYKFNFYSHPQVRDDQIRVRFHRPDGWSISPSQGNTGPNAEGQLTGANDGAPRPFSFTTSSTGIAADGDVATIIMEVITETGGHVNVTTLTTVSGPKIVDPNVTFALETPGPFKAGEDNEVRLSLLNSTLANARVALDVFKQGGRASTFEATETGNGTYTAMVRFPSAGTYTLDAYVSSLKPSPHQEFAVQVEESGFAPGPGPVLVLLALATFAAWRRARA